MLNKFLVAAVIIIGLSLMVPQLVSRFADGSGRPSEARALAPDAARGNSPGRASGAEVYLTADSSGHYRARIEVNGTRIDSLVDTGASLVALSYEDAARVGVFASPGDRKARFHTANGVVEASLTNLKQIRLDNLMLYDVDAAIMPRGAMRGTLLGMSFLKRLGSFESRAGTLVLKP